MVMLSKAEDFTLSVLERVVSGRERLELAPQLLERIERSHAAVREALERGIRVYGVNTGMGYMSQRQLTDDEQRTHQRELLLGRAVGSGPYLAEDETRAVFTCRLRNLISGRSGVSPALVRFLVDRLNDGFTPAIPRRGVGCAGEVIPMSHAFQTFLGIGWVLDERGERIDAAKALAERGVRPLELSLREGSALLAGAPGAIGLSAVRHRSAMGLAQDALVTAASAIHAIGAPADPYSAAAAELTGDATLVDVAAQLRDQLGADVGRAQVLQAPVSFRVVPQVHAHLRRTLARFEEDVITALAGVDDSPAFVEGSFISTGGFHAIDLAAGLDSVALALLRVAELAGQHVHRLLDHRFSGLPDQLATGNGCGLVVVHKRMLGSLNQMRRLAMPASISIADGSLGQEDAMTFSYEAADKLRQVEDLVRDVLACSLLTSRQAWALRGAPPPSPAAVRVADAVEPVLRDRPLGDDLDRLIALIERGELRTAGR